MNIKFRYLFLIAISLLTNISVFAQTPPIVYVSGDGLGDFNCNGVSDQIEINQALDYVATHTDFTTVYLKGINTYIIDEPILISSNTILTGDATVTIQLIENAAWWTYDKSLIAQTGRIGWDPYGDPSENISNVEIHGFTISGGIYQEEPSGDRYNTLLHFTYPYNIKIHDMIFRNGLCDAIRLTSAGRFHINSEVYNNEIYNCKHDGIGFVNTIGCNAHHNKIYSTRTNSGIRASHCDSIYFHHNIIGNSLSLPASGYAGIQIQNSSEQYPCTYANIYENIIYGKCEGIHLGEEQNQPVYPTGTMHGVHIHHNRIYKTKTVSTGTVDLTGSIVVMGFQNTVIEHNIIDGSISDGIVYRGNAGGGTGYQTIVKNNIVINNHGYGINNEEPTINTFILNNNLVYNNNQGNFNNTISTNDIENDPIFANYSISDQWFHIVATYDNLNEVFKIYINGVKQSEKHVSGFGNIGSNNKNVFLGSYRGVAYWYEEKQDEFAVWNSVLNQNEVTQLYNNGSPDDITGSITNGLQAYFKMENNWNDSSVNGFDAVSSTATFTSDAVCGNYSGVFSNETFVTYPNHLSTTNGLSISVWINKSSLNSDLYQTIFNKGAQENNNHIWLYIVGESVKFELGNGTIREELEAYIINPEDKDYHLKSEYGRWDGTNWVLDTATSPCIDGGYATSDFSNEPMPNGGIVNIGVYGNTAEASKSASASINNMARTDLFIYPNPTTGKIYIQNQDSFEKYQVFSVTGCIVKKGNIKSNQIDLSEIGKGMYFIKLLDNKGNVNVSKLIKE